MLVIEDLGEYIESLGYGTLQEDLFLGIERETPDNQIVLRATGGFVLPEALKETKPTFQIYLRDVSYGVGYRKIDDIFKSFVENGQVVSPSGRKMIIKPIQPPFPLGEDEKNHSMFVFNISVITSID